MPDSPLSVLVLDAHAAIAALHVHGIAATDFSGAIVRAVDARAPQTCGAADENDFACAHRDTIQLLEERNGGEWDVVKNERQSRQKTKAKGRCICRAAGYQRPALSHTQVMQWSDVPGAATAREATWRRGGVGDGKMLSGWNVLPGSGSRK
jgi:hypothetical protein